MNYYERHLGDYAKAAGHLTMLEHGAYTLLMDRYYSTESGIPADQAYRLARARSDEERAAVDAVLNEFFSLVDGIWIKARIESEIVKANARIEAARTNGKAGGRPKKNPEETQQKPDGFCLGSPNETGSKALHTPDTKYQAKEQKPPAPSPASQPSAEGVVMLPLNDGSDYTVTQAQVDEFASLYPAVDVIAALRKMRGWCIAKPKNRKTRRGVLAFVTAWLAKDQDAGGARNGEPNASRFRDPSESLAQRAERKLREGDAREQQRAAGELF